MIARSPLKSLDRTSRRDDLVSARRNDRDRLSPSRNLVSPGQGSRQTSDRLLLQSLVTIVEDRSVVRNRYLDVSLEKRFGTSISR